MFCPVCGYDGLVEPIKWKICPSCGTEFGYSDRGRGYDVLRNHWILSGCKWSSQRQPSPPNWSPSQQLLNIGYKSRGQVLEAIIIAGAPKWATSFQFMKGISIMVESQDVSMVNVDKLRYIFLARHLPIMEYRQG